jgi:tetratricopeptide (TPR) repeat protein
MKIIRWLLSHSFLILIIVAVIYGYMFWGNLAGKDTPVGKTIAYLSEEFVGFKEFVEAVKAKQAKLEGGQPSDSNEQVTTTTDSVATITEQNTSSVEATSSGAEQQPVSISYSHNNTRVQQDSTGLVTSEIKISDEASTVASGELMQSDDGSLAANQRQAVDNSMQQDTVSTVAVSESNEVFVSPDIEKRLGNVDESGKEIKETLGGDAVREAWITARKAYYQRNYELSEQSYQKVIDSTEDNFDAYGELGNVYFNQGKNEQAASVYYEAAAILVRKGQVKRARSLMGLLRHLDKSKADELQKLIDSDLS